MKRIIVLLAGVAVLLLSGCGGGSEEGVQLEAVGRQQPSATPVVTAEAEAEQGTPGLAGRLLLLRGQTFEIYDLATGDLTVLDGPPAYSEAQFSADDSRAAYVAFPDYGLIDFTTGETQLIENPAGNHNNMALSPDGRWLMSQAGTFRSQLRVLPADGSEPVLLASGANTFFPAGWTADSRLVWWDNATPDDVMVFDPATGESTPAQTDEFEVASGTVGVASPDGTQLVAVPVGAGTPADPDACFDSYVNLLPPVVTVNVESQGEAVWTEPGLVASSPQWLDDHRLLFVKLGTGACGVVEGEPVRQIMLYDLDAGRDPLAVAGPLGNADDPNDESQIFGQQVTHLYSPSPDGQYVAWIDGGRQVHETMINVTDIATGETGTILRLGAEQATDLADYIEGMMYRQVVWMP